MYGSLQSDFASLKSKINHDKEKDLIKFKEEIKQELNTEIASRYYNEDGRIESSFKSDQEILKATELLKDANKYQGLLLPAK